MLTSTKVGLEKKRKARIFNNEFYPLADALHSFAYGLTHSSADAEDLVQETYLKAFRYIDSYTEDTNAKAWLFRILKNAFINSYRKKANRPTQVDFDEVHNYRSEQDSALRSFVDLREEIYNNVLGDEITNAISTLSLKYRTVLWLIDIEGFSYEEVKDILDIPIGTVRSRLSRARDLLKIQLVEYAKSFGYEDKRK